MEQKTLVERLEELFQISEFGSRHSITLSGDELGTAREGILEDFYAQNPLAFKVAQGNASFSDEVRFIEGKYDSFWKRALCPKKDESFDEEVKRVLNSMSQVGIYSKSSEKFTTKTRRDSIRSSDLFGLLLGGFITTVGLNIPLVVQQRDITTYLTSSTTCLLGAAFPCVFRRNKYLSFVSDLDSLRSSAQETDDFLQNYANSPIENLFSFFRQKDKRLY